MTLLSTPSPDENRRPNVVALAFETEYETDPANPGQFRQVDFVRWARRGDLQYTVVREKVSRMMTPMSQMDGDQHFPNPVWMAIKPAYDAWKAGQDTPVGGTALEAWPQLVKPQIAVLRAAGYRAVEDIAAITDGDLSRVRLPNARRIRDAAQAWLAAQKGQVDLDKMMSARDNKVRELEAMVAEMAAALRAQAAASMPQQMPDHVDQPPPRRRREQPGPDFGTGVALGVAMSDGG